MQFIQHATVLSLEICQLSPAAPLHIMSPVSVGPPNHLMWFLVPEQKQQCQQSYSCSSCSLSKDNFSVFTDMHLHNSFSSQSLPHCQDKLPQIISLLCQTSFFFWSFSHSDLLLCTQVTLCLPLQEQQLLGSREIMPLIFASRLSCLSAPSDCF